MLFEILVWLLMDITNRDIGTGFLAQGHLDQCWLSLSLSLSVCLSVCLSVNAGTHECAFNLNRRVSWAQLALARGSVRRPGLII